MRTQRDKALEVIERFGGTLAGAFHPGGMPLSHLAEAYGTPFYLYRGELIVDRLRQVQAALGEHVEIFYSLKANPSLAITQILARAGTGAEVASGGELELASAAGFPASDIVFAGPGKTDVELERAVQLGIFAVNVESLSEIDRLAAVATSNGCSAGVGLRINPARQLLGSQMRMGGLPSQFGIDETDLEEAVRRAIARPNLILRGIHVYTATQVFDVDALLEQCQAVFDIGHRAAGLAGRTLEMIDFGGGFGVPYFDRMPEFDLDRFGQGFQELAAAYRPDPLLNDCRFIFELGRYLVADAGIYVTHVVDVKRSRDKTFVVTDGGMHHHLAATGNLGQVFRKPYPLLNLSRIDEEPTEAKAVVGSCCTPLDVFGSEIPLAEPEIGDLIGVFYSGAYGLSASNLHFLSHPTPAEILLWQGDAHLLRAPGAPEDVLIGQQSLKEPSDSSIPPRRDST